MDQVVILWVLKCSLTRRGSPVMAVALTKIRNAVNEHFSTHPKGRSKRAPELLVSPFSGSRALQVHGCTFKAVEQSSPLLLAFTIAIDALSF